MDVFPKFIIENFEGEGDCLILGKCTYHKQLAYDIKNVKGGGWWLFDKENLTFILSGESYDFGKAKIEDIENCVKNKKVFSNYSLLNNLSERYSFKYKNETRELIDLNHKNK